MSTYHYLHRKIERVLKAFLAENMEQSVNTHIWLEVTALGEALAEPWIGIRCKSSESATPEVQLPLGAGNRNLSVELSIRSHAIPETSGTDPLSVITEWATLHEALVGKVVDCFYRDDIIAALNAKATETGAGVVVVQIDQLSMSDELLERSGVTQVTIPLMCAPVEVTP